ncbi:hypothetical protein EV421DRAFT_1900618 [Armillaria borealis]|uniref:Uncharacterized protein n=1 Tax=Armillaria borealis TaxID=47425 RepID=A0AA39MUW2_9AGAR|nr:hypothetical protein EV421DRAFT_1900618 [Armillaria borealis]
MLNSTEYCLSTTPKPYESASTPEGLTLEQYKVFTEERTAVEEKYEEAVGAHDMWKAAKAKEVRLEKLKADKEARVEKLKILQKEEEEQKAAEEKRKEEERQAAILKEQQDAVEKKKKDDLKKEKEEKEAAKRLRKEQRKVEKVVKAVESSKGKGTEKAAEAALIEEEKGADADTEEEMLEGTKKKALKKLKEIRDGKRRVTAPIGPKRKWAPKSTSVVEESDGESRPGPSKRVKMEILGPTEGEEEMIGNKRSSEKSIYGHTCSHCKTKKAACSFNKGTLSTLAVGSEEISELLEKTGTYG